ncbi:MAG: hypothetical protein MZV70_62255 [Desulfobacterales bacterium]|nr:hypothetical protein [Desulfobacterales bacterium]
MALNEISIHGVVAMLRKKDAMVKTQFPAINIPSLAPYFGQFAEGDEKHAGRKGECQRYPAQQYCVNGKIFADGREGNVYRREGHRHEGKTRWSSQSVPVCPLWSCQVFSLSVVCPVVKTDCTP